MDKILNFNLLKNPLNWIIVLLMVLFAYIGAELVFNQFSNSKA